MKKYYDAFHKIAVTALIGLTAFGTITLGGQLVYYFGVIRPERDRISKAKNKTDIYFIMQNFISSKIFNFLKPAKSLVWAHSFNSDIKKRTWNILRVNHLALATQNLQNSSSFYKDILGIKTSQEVALPDHGVSTIFVEMSNTKLELLKPLGNNSPIANFLEKNPNGGIHHICFEVDNIQNAIKDLRENKIRLLNDEPKIGAHGKPVIFLHPKDCGGVLIELEQV